MTARSALYIVWIYQGSIVCNSSQTHSPRPSPHTQHARAKFATQTSVSECPFATVYGRAALCHVRSRHRPRGYYSRVEPTLLKVLRIVFVMRKKRVCHWCYSVVGSLLSLRNPDAMERTQQNQPQRVRGFGEHGVHTE